MFAVTIGLGAAAACAEDQKTIRNETPPTVTSPIPPLRSNVPVSSQDQSLATCISIDSHAQITLAKFVEKKTSNDQVRRFAAILRKDHQALLGQLERFTPEAERDTLAEKTAAVDAAVKASPEKTTSTASTLLSALLAANQAPPAAATPAPAAPNPANPVPAIPEATRVPTSNVDFIELHREMASQWVLDTEAHLSKLSGEEFDIAYVGLQIAKRGAMATELKVLQRHASAELAPLLKLAQSTVEAEKIHAEKLMKGLTGDDDTPRNHDSDKRD